MKRSLAQLLRGKGDKILLSLAAISAYGLAFVPPYSGTEVALMTQTAAPVLVAGWLFGFRGGLAAALLSFPLNTMLLSMTGQNGLALLTRPGALQGSILVLVLGVVVGGLHDIGRQLKAESDARRSTEDAREESDRRYRMLADGASDGILTLDGSLRAMYANSAAARIFGVPRTRLEQLGLTDLVDPAYREVERRRLDDYLGRLQEDGSPAPLELTARRPDGDTVELEVSLGRSMLEGAPVYTAIVRDVSERRTMERELHEARIALIRADRAKSEFISRMSHELRTPLNAILGFAQLLDTATLSSEDREGVQQIRHAGRHLLSLVDEVLDIARIEAGHMALTLEPLEPREIAAQARDLVVPRAAERGVHIDLDGGPWHREVLADQQRLRQVFLNLLSNAIKYNREGGGVSVRCREEKELLRIEVEDEGKGVPEDLVPRLFTPFDRLGAERTGVEGTGVGLSLTRSLVSAMQGEIGYQRAAGGGACFWFTLPFANGTDAAGDESERAPSEAPAEGTSILQDGAGERVG